MSILSNDIYSYYLDHLVDMPFDKQFHFASRLHLWDQDQVADQLLHSLRAEFTDADQPNSILTTVVAKAKETATHGSKNATELRQPYFKKYPMLKVYVSALFRMHFMRIIYDIDSRQQLRELCDPADMLALRRDLLADAPAMAILSTHAINFLYLHDRSLLSDELTLPIGTFLEVGRTQYDESNTIHLQLLVYLYTHCIIGESQFYYRRLPAANMTIYKQMFNILETTIDRYFDVINLDNKCEFLVCAKIMGLTSSLENRIFTEASRSMATDGTYLIDRHNGNPQTDNTTLDKSEHRNVLYLMANRDFRPVA